MLLVKFLKVSRYGTQAYRYGIGQVRIDMYRYIVPALADNLANSLDPDQDWQNTCLTADPGVASSIQAQSHTYVEIDHVIISGAILLPSA